MLLDLNGVLINAGPLYKESLLRALALNGYNLTTQDIERAEGASTRDKLDYLAKIGEISKGNHNSIIREKSQIMSDLIDRHAYTPVQTKEALEYIKGRGLRCAVVTNGNRVDTERMLDKAGIRHYFDSIITREDVWLGKCKPHPLHYLEGAWSLGLRPKECLVFDDTTKGITSAREARCRFHKINKFGELSPELVKCKLESLRIML